MFIEDLEYLIEDDELKFFPIQLEKSFYYTFFLVKSFINYTAFFRELSVSQEKYDI